MKKNLEAAGALKSVENFLYGTDYTVGLHDWLNADYVAEIGAGSCLVTGCDHILGDYRLFIESPDTTGNTTGKYCLVLYSVVGGFHEVRRQVIGGANRVGSWAKVAELAIEWLEDILLPLKAELESELMFDEAYDVESEISADAGCIAECIENIDDYLDADEVDDETKLDWIATEIKDMEMFLQYIKNSLDSCLVKCSDITHCDVGWDDFCGCDYFEDLCTDWSPSTRWTDLDVEDEMDYILSHIFRGADVDDDFLFEIMDRTGYVIAA